MCGVAGMVSLSGAPIAEALIKRMTDAIAHRGPDGEGQWVEGAVGLGHRRLSIIDLSTAAAQPMISADGRYVLSYNGEIYNFRELRAELALKGYVFRSEGDAEVLLNAFAEWGTDALLRFNGMFAFAIWDKKTRQLTLARDRYGIKPLYYALQGDMLAFASEHKAILALPHFARRLNAAGLREYLTFQNFFTDQTLLQDIFMLPAGYKGVYDSASGQFSLNRYWDFSFVEPPVPASHTAYLEELDHLFTQAVERQLVSDVTVGSYLSGGIDSGSITAIAATKHPYMPSFTCGFDMEAASGIELAFDEREKAEAMARHCRTEHYECVLRSGDMERVLPSLAWHLEEPRVGQSYPNYYAAKLARSHAKVVLSGAGGDELFAGYPWRYYRAAGAENFDVYVDRYYDFWQRMVPESSMQPLLAPLWAEAGQIDTRAIFRDVFASHENRLKTPADYINHSLYFEAKTFLHGVLVVEDKLSMAHGLESRVPFLDNDLVDFAMRCPVAFKLNNLEAATHINENEALAKRSHHFTRSSDGKQILRDAMRRHIPDSVANREKQGFSAPDASWFKGESMDFVRRTLLDGDARIHEILDKTTMSALVNDHLEGRTNRRLLIWSLLNLEQWLAGYLP